MQQVDRSFDRYLKGVENGVEDEAPVAFYRDHAPEDYGEAETYPFRACNRSSYFLGGAGRTAAPRSPLPAPRGRSGTTCW